MGTTDPNHPTPATRDVALSKHALRTLRGSAAIRACERALVAASVSAGATLVLGCSGGPDSTALLLALWLLAPRQGFRVVVVCIDHGLRKEAATEAAQVAAVAARLGFCGRTVRVRLAKQASKQAAARTARYEALAAVATEVSADAVLVAHTLEDQAETVVLRFLGGAGLRGLSGMPPARPLSAENTTCQLVRPFLAVEKSALLALLEVAGPLVAPLPFHDPSNHDRSYRRAAIRHDVLPKLSALEPSLGPHLLALSDQLRADADLLDRLAKAEVSGVLVPDAPRLSDQIAAVSLSRLARLPQPLALRVLQQLIGRSLSSLHLHALQRLCSQPHGSQAIDLPMGLCAERRYGTLYLRKNQGPRPVRSSQPPPTAPTIDIRTWGTVSLGSARLRLVPMGPTEPLDVDGKTRVILTLPPPGLPLAVRHPRPGDRLRLPAGHRKLSDLLIDAKVPKSERAQRWVLTVSDQPVWLLGIRSGLAPMEAQALAPLRIFAELVAAPDQD